MSEETKELWIVLTEEEMPWAIRLRVKEYCEIEIADKVMDKRVADNK